jgi:hypothetical protein
MAADILSSNVHKSIVYVFVKIVVHFNHCKSTEAEHHKLLILVAVTSKFQMGLHCLFTCFFGVPLSIRHIWHHVQTSSGAHQLPVQWVLEALSLGVKQPDHEADHSPPSSAKVRECMELYLHCPNTSSWCGAYVKHRNNLTFTLQMALNVGLAVHRSNEKPFSITCVKWVTGFSFQS